MTYTAKLYRVTVEYRTANGELVTDQGHKAAIDLFGGGERESHRELISTHPARSYRSAYAAARSAAEAECPCAYDIEVEGA